jgi:hypothetical protein
MENEPPEWPQGEHYAYHTLSLGFYEGELIRRVDPAGRSLGTVLAEDLTGPLGAEVHVRVPEDLPDDRFARLVMPGIVRQVLGMPIRMLPAMLNPRSHVFRASMVNPGTLVAMDPDRVVLREVEVPAGGGVATARGLARLYGEFATGGRRLGLRPETLDALSAPAIPPRGGSLDMCLKSPVSYSLGFMKPFPLYPFGSPSAFGAPGAGGSFAFADPEAMTRQMTGAKMVVQALKDQGVEVVFGYPGGAVLPIYDEIFQQNDIRHILVRHEQGAVHAAEGYARATGKPGVVLVTSGPGATNAVTGLTDALMDSIPIVVLTGQVPTFMIGNDAFQEADTVGITRPCTKHNWLVKDTDRCPARSTRRSTSPPTAAPARCSSTSPRTCSSPPAATRKNRARPRPTITSRASRATPPGDRPRWSRRWRPPSARSSTPAAA